MSSAPPTPSGPPLAQRLAAVVRYRPGPTGRRILLLCGVLLMLGGLVLALRQHPLSLEDMSWPPLALVLFVGVPTMVLFSASAFQLTGLIVGVSCRLRSAVEVSIIGTAANLLPIPGGTITRVAALRLLGASYRLAAAATVSVAGVWMGLYLVGAGACITWVGSLLVGAGFLAVGGLASIAALVWIGHVSRPGLSVRALLLQVGLFATDVGRIFFCLHALGVEATLAQATALAAAAVAGSAVALVPAGLGIREAASAAIGPLVGVDPAVGFLAAGLNRVLALSILVPLGTVLALRRDRSKPGPNNPTR